MTAAWYGTQGHKRRAIISDRQCAQSGCVRNLQRNNVSGYCAEHKGVHWSTVLKYGITRKERDALLASQDFKCAGCGVGPIEFGQNGQVLHPAVVDHNHNTKKIRAILCSVCNTSLGHYEAVRSWAAAYLEEHDGT